jgi:hypothetical protein
VCAWDWVKASEPIALWVEGLALVAIFIYDRKDSRRERKEAHADRVAAIYEKMREFFKVVVNGIQGDDFGPGRRFEYYKENNYSIYPGDAYPMKQYTAIWEAYYSSILVNEKLAAYIKERVDEANNLQSVEAVEEFNNRLKVFYQNWRGDVMAKKMWELS